MIPRRATSVSARRARRGLPGALPPRRASRRRRSARCRPCWPRRWPHRPAPRRGAVFHPVEGGPAARDSAFHSTRPGSSTRSTSRSRGNRSARRDDGPAVSLGARHLPPPRRAGPARPARQAPRQRAGGSNQVPRGRGLARGVFEGPRGGRPGPPRRAGSKRAVAASASPDVRSRRAFSRSISERVRSEGAHARLDGASPYPGARAVADRLAPKVRRRSARAALAKASSSAAATSDSARRPRPARRGRGRARRAGPRSPAKSQRRCVTLAETRLTSFVRTADVPKSSCVTSTDEAARPREPVPPAAWYSARALSARPRAAAMRGGVAGVARQTRERDRVARGEHPARRRPITP